MANRFSKKIISKVEHVILQPKEFWAAQKNKRTTQAKLLAGYMFPLLLMAAVAVFLGEFFRSSHFYMGFAVLKALREILLFVIQYFLAVFLTNEMIKTFGGEKNLAAVQKLVVYSMTPFLLVSAVTGLFQFLYVLDVLGIYSFYIFWFGAKELLVLPEQKQSSYIILAIVVNFFSFNILSILLSKLLTLYF